MLLFDLITSVWFWAAVVAIKLILLGLMGVRYIPANRLGIVEKRFGTTGSVKSGLIALEGEAGFQPAVLRGGSALAHAAAVPRAHDAAGDDPAGQDRLRLRARRPAARRRRRRSRRNVDSRNFEDVAAFLAHGGQRGPQRPDPARRHLRDQPGAVRRHHRGALLLPAAESRRRGDVPARWRGIIEERGGFDPVVIKGADDLIGIVTVHDGPSLEQGEIIAPTSSATTTTRPALPQQLPGSRGVPRRRRPARSPAPGARRGHVLHQPALRDGRVDPQDGRRGRPSSASSSRYTGEIGNDLSGAEYKHGELVETRPARRVERAAAARQVRVQHLRGQGDHGADDQLHPEVDP